MRSLATELLGFYYIVALELRLRLQRHAPPFGWTDGGWELATSGCLWVVGSELPAVGEEGARSS